MTFFVNQTCVYDNANFYAMPGLQGILVRT